MRGVGDVHARRVVRPGAELDQAALLIERKIPDVNIAGGRENPARLPVDVSVVAEENANLPEVRG